MVIVAVEPLVLTEIWFAEEPAATLRTPVLENVVPDKPIPAPAQYVVLVGNKQVQ